MQYPRENPMSSSNTIHLNRRVSPQSTYVRRPANFCQASWESLEQLRLLAERASGIRYSHNAVLRVALIRLSQEYRRLQSDSAEVRQLANELEWAADCKEALPVPEPHAEGL